MLHVLPDGDSLLGDQAGPTSAPHWQLRFRSQHLCQGLCRNAAICLLPQGLFLFPSLHRVTLLLLLLFTFILRQFQSTGKFQ